MPTMLIIDADPATHALVRAVAPQWTIVAATDSVTGVDLARRQLEQLDLVLLDMDLPGIDSADTALLLRGLSPTLPILPCVTAAAAPLLAELGCLPPLRKLIGRAALRAALHAARSAARPEIRPGPAMLALMQRAATAREPAARQELRGYHIAAFATCVITRRGLALYLDRMAPAFLAEIPTPEALERRLRTSAIDAIVADARDHAIIRIIGGAYAVPILLVASTLLDGLIAAMYPAVAGVLFTRDDPATALTAALTAVTSGQAYRSPALHAPFAGLGLTPRAQTHLALEAQQRSVKASADCLGVDTKTVSKYRQRLCAKLGLAHGDELVVWACACLQPRESGVGE